MLRLDDVRGELIVCRQELAEPEAVAGGLERRLTQVTVDEQHAAPAAGEVLSDRQRGG